MDDSDSNSEPNVPVLEANTEVSREELYALVWSKPMLEIARRFGVSSSYMASVCQHLNVPRPPRGYWAKVAAGKSLGRIPALPPPLPGNDQLWARGASGFRSPASDPVGLVETKGKISSNQHRKLSKHPLLEGAKEFFGRTQVPVVRIFEAQKSDSS